MKLIRANFARIPSSQSQTVFPDFTKSRYNEDMELTLKTEGGLIKAVAVECEYYPAIELFVNNKLYGLLEYMVEDRQFAIRVYNDDQDYPVFNQKFCTM